MTDAPLPSDPVKAALLQTDETFRRLVREHQTLDERIHVFDSYAHLTAQQQFEQASLKKKKLALKDRIESIVRHNHSVTSSLPHR